MRAHVFVALSLFLAGCVQSATQETPATPGVEGFTLDCSIGRPTWAETCLAHASPNDSPSKTEIDLAVNPVDPLNVVVASKDLDLAASQCVWAVAQVSKDGGRTWTTSYVGGTRDQRRPGEPLYGWHCITDPILAFDAKGTLYYSLQVSDYVSEGDALPDPARVSPNPGSVIMLARSKDGGLTWDKIIDLLPGEGKLVFHDYMRVAVNPKTQSHYTVWNQFTITPIPRAVPLPPLPPESGGNVVPILVATRDGGETAAPPVYLPVPEEARSGVVMRGLAVGNDGTTYVLIRGQKTAYLTVSTDDARTFSRPVPIFEFGSMPRMFGNNTYRTPAPVELAIDNSGGPRDGCLYATWAEFDKEVNDSDIHVRSSCDQGKTWTDPALVNDGAYQRHIQWIPRPVVDGAGDLHILYFDRSRDDADHGVDATWAVSRDGGATFAVRRLTEHPFDPALGVHQSGGAFIGDYNGIGASPDALWMSFPTTITGKAEIAVAKMRLP